MIPTPTLHLRFVERLHADYGTGQTVMAKPVRILQQFWRHPDGKDNMGDMFASENGTWRDVPVVREAQR